MQLVAMISRLHYITQDLPDFSHAQLAEFSCKGGADWVQLRIKYPLSDSPPKGEREIQATWLKIAEETKSICKKYGAKLIINDNVLLAKEIEADGVHLGKEDMNPKEARKILGNNFIIGGTANSLEDVKQQIENKVDYIGLGPYRFTSTKEKLSPVLGLNGIKNIIRTMPPALMGLGGGIPVIAIGGIRIEDVKLLMQTGIHGVAVSSAINLAEDKSEMTKKFISSILMANDFSQFNKITY